RAADLVSLLCMIALRHQNQFVTRRQVAESLFNLREKFDLLLGNGLCEADDAAALLIIHRLRTEAFKAGHERTCETGQPISMSKNGFALDSVERLAHFDRRVLVVIEVANER